VAGAPRRAPDPGDLASVDAMAEEHRHIPSALAGVDAALRGGGELTAPAGLLSAVVLDHLAHEEREVLPPYRAAPDPGAVARVPAHRTEPPLATGTARVPDLDPGRRRRAGCGGGPGRDAATGPAGLPPGAPPPLRRAASVADPRSRHETLNWPPVTRPGHRERPAAEMTSHLRQRAGKWPARPRTQPVMRPARTVRSPPGSGRWLVFG
jgi:hypothetical protein